MITDHPKELEMRWTLLLAAAVLPWNGLAAQSQPLDSAAIEALRRVLRLPQTTADARQAGVSDSAIRVVLDQIRRRGVPAGDAQEVVEAETEAVKAGASKDNFGAFVQSQLAAGKRGRELAEAIRAEHARQGHGPKGAGAAHGHEHGAGGAADEQTHRPSPRSQMDSASRARGDSIPKGKGRRQ
jgi:hypothetical protein